MPTTMVEPITHEHAELIGSVHELAALARELPRLPAHERLERRNRIVAFLEGVLLPHAKAEEQGLYQRVSQLLGHPEATAPMVYDHIAVRERTAKLAAADVADVDGLQELLYGLHALVVEHFRKEEELYEPLLHRHEAQGAESFEAPALRHEP